MILSFPNHLYLRFTIKLYELKWIHNYVVHSRMTARFWLCLNDFYETILMIWVSIEIFWLCWMNDVIKLWDESPLRLNGNCFWDKSALIKMISSFHLWTEVNLNNFFVQFRNEDFLICRSFSIIIFN